MSGHQALIGIQVLSNRGFDFLKRSLAELKPLYSEAKTSSVYRIVKKVYVDAREIQEPLEYEVLTAAIKITTDVPPLELKQKLIKFGESTADTSNNSKQLELLVYDDLCLMTPALTLPFPELHLRPELLVPAAEAWGDYLHPVLQANLSQVVTKFDQIKWGEFHAQGKSLLDF
jgi:7,8-dihydro-6-hydroxymethylpterin-pyrophosphokinase